MCDIKKILNVLASSAFIIGLVITISDAYTPKLVGLLLLIGSLSLLYYNYIKDHKIFFKKQKIDIKQSSLGLFLIVSDILYNILTHDSFKSFDIAMLLSGVLILALNLRLLNFLKIDEEMSSFASYFIFFSMCFYAFFFTGLRVILGDLNGSNPFWAWFNENVVYVSSLFLGLLKPTFTSGMYIIFDGFGVGIDYACSGIESISVFLAAVIAYFIAKKEQNWLKVVKYLLIGTIMLYTINIIRVIIIILVGYLYGMDSMMFVHVHMGWILFVTGMSVFWYLVFYRDAASS